MPRALSHYQQVRVTITEEAGGWVTVRVLAKPVDADWTLRNSVWHHRFKMRTGTQHWTNLVAVALQAILGERLPTDD